jgi:hypothetical protein
MLQGTRDADRYPVIPGQADLRRRDEDREQSPTGFSF